MPMEAVTHLLHHQILLSPGTSDWLVELMVVLAPVSASPACSPALRALASNARHLLVAFCSLSGDVLPKRPKAVTGSNGRGGSEADLTAAAAAQGELSEGGM